MFELNAKMIFTLDAILCLVMGAALAAAVTAAAVRGPITPSSRTGNPIRLTMRCNIFTAFAPAFTYISKTVACRTVGSFPIPGRSK